MARDHNPTNRTVLVTGGKPPGGALLGPRLAVPHVLCGCMRGHHGTCPERLLLGPPGTCSAFCPGLLT